MVKGEREVYMIGIPAAIVGAVLSYKVGYWLGDKLANYLEWRKVGGKK